MTLGLFGKKLGMTQVWEDGNVVPVTIVALAPNTVLGQRTQEADGYSAVRLGAFAAKEKHLNRAQLVEFEKLGVSPCRLIREVRLSADHTADVGHQLSVSEVFEAGQLVDVTGVSKGKGHAGVMKRHNFAGQSQTHGNRHEWTRHGGSIGTRLTPGRVFKGKKMSGHMGSERVTTHNLRLVRIDADEGLAYIRGAVPGGKNGTVLVRHPAKVKRPKQPKY